MKPCTVIITIILITLNFTPTLAEGISYPKHPLIDRYSLEEPMQFHTESDLSGCQHNGCEWASAVGIITEDTPAKFLEFIGKLSYKPLIVFASNGGNVIAGLKLGELIRQHGFSTDIGYTQTTDDREFGAQYYKAVITKGSCLSSCAYAFLGGLKRSLGIGSKYGIHQHYDLNSLENFKEKTATQLDRTFDQMVTGVILEYVIQMGISPKIVSTASTQTPEGIYYLNAGELVNWRITNDEEKYSLPTISPFGVTGAIAEIKHLSGYYANYERPTKYRLYCKGSSKTLHIAIINEAKYDSELANTWIQIIENAEGFEFTGSQTIISRAIPVFKETTNLPNGYVRNAVSWMLPDLKASELISSDVVYPSQKNGGAARAIYSVETEMGFKIVNGDRHLKIVLNNCIR